MNGQAVHPASESLDHGLHVPSKGPSHSGLSIRERAAGRSRYLGIQHLQHTQDVNQWVSHTHSYTILAKGSTVATQQNDEDVMCAGSLPWLMRHRSCGMRSRRSAPPAVLIGRSAALVATGCCHNDACHVQGSGKLVFSVCLHAGILRMQVDHISG